MEMDGFFSVDLDGWQGFGSAEMEGVGEQISLFPFYMKFLYFFCSSQSKCRVREESCKYLKTAKSSKVFIFSTACILVSY